MLKIEEKFGKTGGNLVKVWDKRWSKLPKVLTEWFAILTILKLLLRLRLKNLKFCSSLSKNVEFAYVSPENFFDLTTPPPPPPVDNIFMKNFYDLVKILVNVGQNMTTSPPPPMLMASRRPCVEPTVYDIKLSNVVYQLIVQEIEILADRHA